MTGTTIAILIISILLTIGELIARVPSQHLAIPAILALSGSPAFKPNRWSVLLTIISALAVACYLLLHFTLSVALAFIVAVVSAAGGLIRRRLASRTPSRASE